MWSLPEKSMSSFQNESFDTHTQTSVLMHPLCELCYFLLGQSVSNVVKFSERETLIVHPNVHALCC